MRNRVRWLKARLLTVAAWSLLVAILPTLTYMGHWPRELELPGTHLFLGSPTPAETHDHADEGARHERHCHGSPATCSDVPFTGDAGFGLLNESLAPAVSGALLVAVAGRWWRPGPAFAPPPELRPPRGSAVFAS